MIKKVLMYFQFPLDSLPLVASYSWGSNDNIDTCGASDIVLLLEKTKEET